MRDQQTAQSCYITQLYVVFAPLFTDKPLQSSLQQWQVHEFDELINVYLLIQLLLLKNQLATCVGKYISLICTFIGHLLNKNHVVFDKSLLYNKVSNTT